MAKTMTGKDYIPYASLSKGQQEIVDNPDWLIRYVAASGGHGLDVLVNDLDPAVRREVAKQGYGLDQLINDREGSVRAVVAYQEYGLDQLRHDDSWDVQDAVKAVLGEQKQTIEEWIAANPGRCALPENQARKVDLELDPADELMKEIDDLKSEIAALQAENMSLEAILNERNKEIESLKERYYVDDPSLGTKIAVDTKLHDKSIAELKLADMEYFEPAQQYVFDNGPDGLYIDVVTRNGEKVCDWDLFTAGTKVMGTSENPIAALDAAKERHAELNGYKPDAKKQKPRPPKSKAAQKATLSQDVKAAKAASRAQAPKQAQKPIQTQGAR